MMWNNRRTDWYPFASNQTGKGFRFNARAALGRNLKPEQVWWVEDDAELAAPPSSNRFTVPREYLGLAKFVACHPSAGSMVAITRDHLAPQPPGALFALFVWRPGSVTAPGVR